MRIRIREDRCIGAGLCVDTSAEVFSQREEDGISVVLLCCATQEQVEAARTAAALCPAHAIEIAY